MKVNSYASAKLINLVSNHIRQEIEKGNFSTDEIMVLSMFSISLLEKFIIFMKNEIEVPDESSPSLSRPKDN